MKAQESYRQKTQIIDHKLEVIEYKLQDVEKKPDLSRGKIASHRQEI